MSLQVLDKIQEVTELECGDISSRHPLLSMIVQHASNGQLDCQNNRGLYVVSSNFLLFISFFFFFKERIF